MLMFSVISLPVQLRKVVLSCRMYCTGTDRLLTPDNMYIPHVIERATIKQWS